MSPRTTRSAPCRRIVCGWLGYALVWATLTAAAPAEPHDSAPNQRTLTVSAATDNYPYSFRGDDGRLTGYGVDMLNAVAEVMHVRLERVEVPAVEDINNLIGARCDIGQFHSIMPGRGANVAYSQPFLINYGDVFVRAGDRRFTSVEDLHTRHAQIATPQQGREFLLSIGFAPDCIRLSTSTEAMLALSKGEVDAVLITRLTGLTQAYYHKIDNVEPLGLSLPGFKVSFGIATRRDDHELLGQINEALATLSTTGRTVEIYSRWFGRYESRGATLSEMLAPAAAILAAALLATLWLLRRQHLLQRRVARQTEELRLSREILAEAQRFARLGHSRRSLTPGEPAVWSEETYRIFERDPAAGVPAFDELLALAVPADRARWRAALENTRRGGPPYEFDIEIEPAPGRRKILNVRGRPTFDSLGHQDGTFGTVQDVTASRAAAAALQQSELLLRALYDNLPLALGVAELQPDGWHVLSLNPEALHQLGIAPHPPAGAPLTALGLPSERCEFWRERFDRSTVLGEPLRFELETPDSRKHFAAAVVPLVLPGLPPRCCLLSEEITTRKLKDAELAQGRRLRAIGELVGGIAHEFNNLITPITLNTELLLAQCADRPALRDELGIIADAAKRAGDLTRRLLTFGRRSDQHAEKIDLAAIIASNIALIRHTFDRRIAIRSDLPASMPPLHLRAGDLHQILLNLLLNARDALADKLAHPPSSRWSPRIEISAAILPAVTLAPINTGRAPAPAAWVRLTVRDNGCGMPPAVRERLFEPFFTTKGVGNGTGLGLATLWHIVAEFGGRIDVDTIPGEGSAFHLGLPLHEIPRPTAPAAPAPRPAPPPPPTDGHHHFLLADDETSVARVVTRVLERKGHRVTAATDGLVAWEKLSTAPAAFDAVIMDLNMPGITGQELARRARALPFTGPLIVMSGRIGDEEKSQLDEIGIDALLPKPFSIAAFEAGVAAAFAKRAAQN